MEEYLVLDPKIRDWVLFPILLVMFLVGILRHFISKAFATPPTSSLLNVREMQLLARAEALRANANHIPVDAFLQHKAYFNNKTHGQFQQTVAAANPMSMMSDPSSMMGMMKNNIAMIVPQLVIVAWVSYFFAGFLILKLPFPLTPNFKGMLQRGVSLTTLDVSYVSSLSWYFLNMMGLRGLFSIILGDGNAADESKLMQQQMAGPMAAPGQFDKAKAFSTTRDHLQLIRYEFSLEDAEERLLEARDISFTHDKKVTGMAAFPSSLGSGSSTDPHTTFVDGGPSRPGFPGTTRLPKPGRRRHKGRR